MQNVLQATDEQGRRNEREQIMQEEMNISDFQVEPEVEQCLTDFVIKPYATPDEIQHEWEGAPPLHFYDNDDGFWDDYIEHKNSRWEENGMITNRRFFKH